MESPSKPHAAKRQKTKSEEEVTSKVTDFWALLERTEHQAIHGWKNVNDPNESKLPKKGVETLMMEDGNSTPATSGDAQMEVDGGVSVGTAYSVTKEPVPISAVACPGVEYDHEYCGCPLCPNSPNTLARWASYNPWEDEDSEMSELSLEAQYGSFSP